MALCHIFTPVAKVKLLLISTPIKRQKEKSIVGLIPSPTLKRLEGRVICVQQLKVWLYPLKILPPKHLRSTNIKGHSAMSDMVSWYLSCSVSQGPNGSDLFWTWPLRPTKICFSWYVRMLEFWKLGKEPKECSVRPTSRRTGFLTMTTNAWKWLWPKPLYLNRYAWNMGLIMHNKFCSRKENVRIRVPFQKKGEKHILQNCK